MREARPFGVSFLLVLVAVVIFILAALNVTLGSLSVLDEIAFGLAAFAASFIVP